MRTMGRFALQPFDMLAFSGKARVSQIIKLGTLSRVSHVAVMLNDSEVVESTTLRGFSGVVRHAATDLEETPGPIWLMRLSPANQPTKANLRKAQRYLAKQEGKEYDTQQALFAGIDWFWRARYRNLEDGRRLFCSEYATLALEAANVIAPSTVAAEVTPGDMVRWPIWKRLDNGELPRWK